jgi:hypothetical protein
MIKQSHARAKGMKDGGRGARNDNHLNADVAFTRRVAPSPLTRGRIT